VRGPALCGRFYLINIIYRSIPWRKIFVNAVELLKQDWINSAGKAHHINSMFPVSIGTIRTCNPSTYPGTTTHLPQISVSEIKSFLRPAWRAFIQPDIGCKKKKQ
jgi:hypothetical protein